MAQRLRIDAVADSMSNDIHILQNSSANGQYFKMSLPTAKGITKHETTRSAIANDMRKRLLTFFSFLQQKQHKNNI